MAATAEEQETLGLRKVGDGGGPGWGSSWTCSTPAHRAGAGLIYFVSPDLSPAATAIVGGSSSQRP